MRLLTSCKTHLLGVSSLLGSTRPLLKGEFISGGLILFHLWCDCDSVYANLCLSSLHIKWLILSFGECALKEKSTLINSWHESPVFGSYFGWQYCALHSSGWVCLITGHTSGLRAPSLQALTLFGGIRFITWRYFKGNADKA